MTLSITGNAAQTAIVVLQDSITTMQLTHVEENQEAIKTQESLKKEADDLRKRAAKLQTENENLQKALNATMKIHEDRLCKSSKERENLRLETQTLTNDVTAQGEKNAQLKTAVKDCDAKKTDIQECIVTVPPGHLYRSLGIINLNELCKWRNTWM